MFCSSCGTRAQEGAIYCAICGARLLPPVAATPATAASDVAYRWESTTSVSSPPAGTAYPPGFGPPPAGTAYPPGYGPPPAGAYRSGANVRLDPVLNLPLAPWWKRLLAIILDGAILGSGYFVLFAIIGIVANTNSTTTSTNTSTQAGSLVLGFVVLIILASIPNALYFGLMNGSRRGQTVGKMALGIAVRDARSGQPIGFWRAVGRTLITALFEILLYVPYVIDSLAPLWDRRRQAWHDKVAHTVVVDLNP